MIKNIAIMILVLVAIIEGVVIFKHKSSVASPQMITQTQKPKLPPAGPNARGGKLIILSKGMNLKTTPLMKYAYQIAPGTISDNSKKALIGWNVVSTSQADGSILVSLTPKDSDDQSQQYTIKKGQILYFIEQTLSDDKADSDTDLNYRDDYGIITDQNGIIM